ncbi:hypothetical protein [Pseudomonas sp. LRF_L74]|uniref:hypothetical protein n=1 Tax=Pseudomonas sp. LRF_L74 TaxID=3369422 RepID=UPI003F6236FE
MVFIGAARIARPVVLSWRGIALEANIGIELPIADQRAKLKLELQDQISAETVNPIIDVLNKASASDLIEIHLRHNAGGNVDRMIALIEALNGTAAQVEITFSRYVMSAAATLWLWFFLRESPNVKSLYPKKKGVVMYHRPRRQRGGYLCFCDEMEDTHPLKAPLREKLKIFDDLFEEVFELMCRIYAEQESQETLAFDLHVEGEQLRYRHSMDRMREAYYGNQDCLIPV